MEEVKKEVQINSKEVQKDTLLDIILVSIQAGKTTKQIKSDLKISKQKLQYYLDKLKSQNKIQKIGYGVWQQVQTAVGRSVRGHGFLWHIKLPKEINIWEQILTKKNIKFKKINNGSTFEIYFKENRVWISKNSILIYDIKSYFGFNAVDSKKYAMVELQSYLIELQAKLGIDFKVKGNFVLKTSRQHYALVRNSLAMQCRKDGTKINVYNERGLWFTIDNSFNLEEAETVHKDTALVDNLGVQKFFNEHKETGWEVSPKFILNGFNQLTNNLNMYAENMVSHVKAVQDLGNSAEANAKSVELLSDVILQLKEQVISLTEEISRLKNGTKV